MISDVVCVLMQAEVLKKHVASQPGIRPQVVIVSPMTRAIETAIGAFGGQTWKKSEEAKPLMREQQAVEVQHPFFGFCTLGFVPLPSCHLIPNLYSVFPF